MTLCIRCKKPAYERCYSDLGRQEVSITGFCELCFDEITLGPDELWPQGYLDLKERLGEEPPAWRPKGWQP